MKNLIVRLISGFKPFTVSQVLADFEKKVKHLEHVHNHRRGIAAKNVKRIERLNQQNEAHHLEAKRAEAVAAKLRALLAD